MRVRIQRSVKVKSDHLTNFLEVALAASDHAEKKTEIRPDVFWVRDCAEDGSNVKIFTDYDSLAQYESLFLEGLLYDREYLGLAEKTVEMIEEEPSDECYVLMDRDDYFMNYKDAKGKAQKAAAVPRLDMPKHTRYRLCHHVDVHKGRLREYMKSAFSFIDALAGRIEFPPHLFCTRFSAERIGCGKVYIDFDNCPECGPALLQQEQILTSQPGLLDRPPVNELYIRVGLEDIGFSL